MKFNQICSDECLLHKINIDYDLLSSIGQFPVMQPRVPQFSANWGMMRPPNALRSGHSAIGCHHFDDGTCCAGPLRFDRIESSSVWRTGVH